jgi:EmrB/QacA subfamily drug resistance transporter
MTILGICAMSLFVVGIDGTAVNLALPSIRVGLGASLSELQWVIDSYVLVLASLLMLSGSVADRVGRRRVFQTGLLLFGLGSLLCSLSGTATMLIASRMLQAVGGSMLNPVAMSIITNTFRDPKERAEAIGIWGGTIGFSQAIGPLVGGALVDAVGWPAIFWINIPIVVTAVVLAAIFVPESRAPAPRRFDPVGQILIATVLTTLTYGIIEGRGLGWGSHLVLGCFSATAASLATLALYERRRHQPVLDPRFFRSVPFTGAVFSAILGFSAMTGFLFLNTLYLQTVRGFSPLHAGILTLPMAGMTVVFAPLSGRIVGRRGSRLPMTVAAGGIATCALILSRLQTDTSLWVIVAAYLSFGVGFGMLNAPITVAAVSGMPRAQAGVAAAVASTSRQVGSVLGVAIFGAVVFARLGPSLPATFAVASHVAWVIMAFCGLGILALGLVTTSSWAMRSRRQVAELLGDG